MKMNRKLYKNSIFLMLVITIMTLCFNVSFAGAGSGSQYNFKIAFIDQFWEGIGLNTQRLSTAINYSSGGQIAFDIFPNSEMGDEQQILQAMQLGNVDMSIGSVSQLAGFTSAFIELTIPFMFDNTTLDELDYIFASENKLTPIMEKELEQASKESGLRFLSIILGGTRNTCFNRPIRSWNETKGLKIRLMPTKVHIEAWKNLGLNPHTLPWSEVYSALQTKVVDAAEMIEVDYLASHFDGVAPYWFPTKHINYAKYVVMSEKAWDSLSPYLQSIVKDVLVRVSYQESISAIGLDEVLIQKIEKCVKQRGGEVGILEKEMRGKMREEVLPKLLDKYSEQIGKDVILQLAKNDEIIKKWCIENSLSVE